MTNYSVYDIADWFLYQNQMSPKKLQKIVYYAYAWTLALHNEDSEHLDNKLFDEEIEAWVHGPVVRELYDQYKTFGYNDITDRLGVKPKFSEDIEATLNEVWEAYGHLNGNELEQITHEEDPWIEARIGLKPLDASNNKLSDATIFQFYMNKLAEENDDDGEK